METVEAFSQQRLVFSSQSPFQFIIDHWDEAIFRFEICVHWMGA